MNKCIIETKYIPSTGEIRVHCPHLMHTVPATCTIKNRVPQTISDAIGTMHSRCKCFDAESTTCQFRMMNGIHEMRMEAFVALRNEIRQLAEAIEAYCPVAEDAIKLLPNLRNRLDAIELQGNDYIGLHSCAYCTSVLTPETGLYDDEENCVVICGHCAELNDPRNY